MKFILDTNEYQYFRMDYSIKTDGLFCLKFRENLRSPVPDDISGIVVSDKIDIDFTNATVEHKVENNEYFCHVYTLTSNVKINKLLPNDISYNREKSFDNVPEDLVNVLFSCKQNYSFNPEVRIARVNGVEILLRVIMDSGEKYVEISVGGAPSYDCNNLPVGWEENDTIYFDSEYDFELLNVPDGWVVDEMRKNINFNVIDSYDEYPVVTDMISMNFGIKTSPNRTLKMMYRIA